MSKGKFYMTTAIAYASGKPHIGNTYEAVLADSISGLREKTDMMSFSRPEQTSMDRKLN